MAGLSCDKGPEIPPPPPGQPRLMQQPLPKTPPPPFESLLRCVGDRLALVSADLALLAERHRLDTAAATAALEQHATASAAGRRSDAESGACAAQAPSDQCAAGRQAAVKPHPLEAQVSAKFSLRECIAAFPFTRDTEVRSDTNVPWCERISEGGRRTSEHPLDSLSIVPSPPAKPAAGKTITRARTSESEASSTFQLPGAPGDSSYSSSGLCMVPELLQPEEGIYMAPELMQPEEMATQSTALDRRLRRNSTIASKYFKKSVLIENGTGHGHVHIPPPKRRAVFPDMSAMREQVQETIRKPEYNVADYYHTTGVWQRIARSQQFDYITLGVIAANALWIAIDMDYNPSLVLMEASVVFQVAEHTFCAYFVSEVVIRFLAFRRKRDTIRDAWFVFDSALAILLVIDTWLLAAIIAVASLAQSASIRNTSILRLVRLLRLVRMSRLVRLLRALPELVMLIKGIGVAVRAVFFTLCFQAAIIYVFALTFRELTKGTWLEESYFPSVPDSAINLVLRAILPDFERGVKDIGREHFLLGLVIAAFVFLATITVMNFIVGVLVEAVKVISAREQESLAINYVKNYVLDMLASSGIDTDGNMQLSKDEFESLLLEPKTVCAMKDMGVDVVGLIDHASLKFQGDSELSFQEFVHLVLLCRGSNTTTVRDIADLRNFLSQELRDIEDNLDQRLTTLMAMSSMRDGASSSVGGTASKRR